MAPNLGNRRALERAAVFIVLHARTDQVSSSFSIPSHNRDRVLGFGLLGFGGLMLASIFHLTGPVFALLVIAAGWYVLNRR